MFTLGLISVTISDILFRVVIRIGSSASVVIAHVVIVIPHMLIAGVAMMTIVYVPHMVVVIIAPISGGMI